MTLKLLRLVSKEKISTEEKVARWLLHLGQVPSEEMEATVVMDSVVSEPDSETSSFLDISEMEECKSTSASSSECSSLTISSISQTYAMEMVARWVETIDHHNLLSVTDTVGECVDDNLSAEESIFTSASSSESSSSSSLTISSISQTYAMEMVARWVETINHHDLLSVVTDTIAECVDDNLSVEESISTSASSSDSSSSSSLTTSSISQTYAMERVERWVETINSHDLFSATDTVAESVEEACGSTGPTGQSTSFPTMIAGCKLAMKKCAAFPLNLIPPVARTTGFIKTASSVFSTSKPDIVKDSVNKSGKGTKKVRDWKRKVHKAFSGFTKIVVPCWFSRT